MSVVSQADLIEKITPSVTTAIRNAVVELTKEHGPAADYSGFSMGERLEKKLHFSIANAVGNHGLRKSLCNAGHDIFVPYRDELEAVAPGLAQRIIDGDADLFDPANGDELGTRAIPAYLVDDMLDADNATSGNMLLPYNRMLPYSAKVLNAAFWGVNPSKVSGDYARGIHMATFWRAVCPPFGVHSNDSDTGCQDRPENARFNLVSALLTMRKCASAPSVQSLDDTFYCEHPDNTIGTDGHRFSFCGPGFMGMKHIAEAWNGLVNTVHGNPLQGTDAHTTAERLLYTSHDVGAALCAISLALAHDMDGKNSLQAEMFFSGKECGVPGSDKTQLLKKPVCHVNSDRCKVERMAMMTEFMARPFDTVPQALDVQRARQQEADRLSISPGEFMRWGHAKDQIVKHHFINSTASRGEKGGGQKGSNRYRTSNRGSDSQRNNGSWRQQRR